MTGSPSLGDASLTEVPDIARNLFSPLKGSTVSVQLGEAGKEDRANLCAQELFVNQLFEGGLGIDGPGATG